MDRLIQLSKSSIVEEAIAALSSIKEACQFDWGLEALADCPTSSSFLIQKQRETPDVVKEWKYSILQSVVMKPQAAQIFAPSVLAKYQQLVN